MRGTVAELRGREDGLAAWHLSGVGFLLAGRGSQSFPGSLLSQDGRISPMEHGILGRGNPETGQYPEHLA